VISDRLLCANVGDDGVIIAAVLQKAAVLDCTLELSTETVLNVFLFWFPYITECLCVDCGGGITLLLSRGIEDELCVVNMILSLLKQQWTSLTVVIRELLSLCRSSSTCLSILLPSVS